MKRIVAAAAAVIMCASLSSCASMQAGFADFVESMAGIEGKTYEEHESYYQSEWDSLEQELEDLKDGLEALNTDADESTSSPEEDSFWAGNRGKTVADVDSSNYSNRFNKGQCTWYAWGRLKEETGIDLNVSGNAKEWVKTCNDDRVTVESEPDKIKSDSIAVFHKPGDSAHWGHVVYVEHVTYDEQGNPDTVYFTECNMDSYTLKDANGNEYKNPKWGVYNEGDDCIVKSQKYEDFISRGTHEILGYLVPN